MTRSATPPAGEGTALARSARAAVASLGIGATDDVLVVCNQSQQRIADALATAAKARAGTTRVLAYSASTRDGEEPPALVIDAMAGATVVFAATSSSISHTRARLDATARGTRIATLPGVTEDLFERLLVVDYADLERAGDHVATKLSTATTCWITSPAGIDLRLDLGGRTAICDAGNLRYPGAFGNLPAGEAYIAPRETVGDGTIVFEGSLAG